MPLLSTTSLHYPLQHGNDDGFVRRKWYRRSSPLALRFCRTARTSRSNIGTIMACTAQVDGSQNHSPTLDFDDRSAHSIEE